MFVFKCRCASRFNQRFGHQSYMSGTWKSHHSLVQLIKPYGLHRTVYQLKDNNPDNIFEDDCWIEIKHRNSSRMLRVSDKDMMFAYF